MRSLMLALGACLFALNFAGCSSTGGSGFLGGGLLGGGNNAGCSGGCACSSGCGNSGCSGNCGQNDFLNKNYGGKSGLGLGLMEAGPSCQAAGCNGGCQSCQQAGPAFGSRMKAGLGTMRAGSCNTAGCDGGCQSCQQAGPAFGSRMKAGLGTMRAGSCNTAGCDGGCQSCQGAMRPQLGSRMKAKFANRGCRCGGGMDCGCGSPTLAVAAPAIESDGCGASAAEYSFADMGDIGDCGDDSDIQLVSHEDRGGLLGKLFGRHKARSANGCGARGCGGPGGLCSRCRARLAGLGAGGTIPHRDPTIHAGGGAAGPAGQIPTYAYPYYTTRAPRDFLDPNPPTIGY